MTASETNNFDIELNEVPDIGLDDELEPDAAEITELEDEEDNHRPSGVTEPELANDPVRMYLKEIGQVQLLEFRSGNLAFCTHGCQSDRRQPVR